MLFKARKNHRFDNLDAPSDGALQRLRSEVVALRQAAELVLLRAASDRKRRAADWSPGRKDGMEGASSALASAAMPAKTSIVLPAFRASLSSWASLATSA